MDMKSLVILLVVASLSLAAPREKRNVGHETTAPTGSDVIDGGTHEEVTGHISADPTPTPEPHDDASDDRGSEPEEHNDVSAGEHGGDKPHIYGLAHGEELNENHTVICQWGHCWVVKPDPPPTYPNESIAWVAGHWDIIIIAFVAWVCIVAAIYLLCSDKTKYYSEHEYQKDHRHKEEDIGSDIKSKKAVEESVRNSGTVGHYNRGYTEDIGQQDETPITRPPAPPTSAGYLDQNRHTEEKKERHTSKEKEKHSKDDMRLAPAVSEPDLNHTDHPRLQHQESLPATLMEEQLQQGASFLQIARPAMPARPVSPAMRRRRQEAGLPPAPEHTSTTPVVIEPRTPVFTLGNTEDSPPVTPPTTPKVTLSELSVNGLHAVGQSEPSLSHSPASSVPSIHVDHSEPALLVTDPDTLQPTFLEVRKPVLGTRPVSPAMRRKRMEAGLPPAPQPPPSPSPQRKSDGHSNGVAHRPVFSLDTTADDVAPAFLDVQRPMGMPTRPVSPAMRKKNTDGDQRVSTISSSNC